MRVVQVRQMRGKRSWPVLAALLLLLQAAVSAWALGSHPLPIRYDVLGNPLCSPAAPSDSRRGDHPAAPRLPDCCSAGCLMLGGYLPPAPRAVAAPPLRQAERSLPLPGDRQGSRGDAADEPYAARGPPTI